MIRGSTLLAAACAGLAALHVAPASAVAASPSPIRMDTVEFVPLETSGNLRECEDVPADGEEPCRVRRQWTAPALRERLARGESAWRDGETLTFAYQDAAAERVVLAGGLQLPLSPLTGTDLWVATVRIPRIDQALVSYVFIPEGSRGPPQRLSFATWRGPRAVEPAPRAARLRGRVVTDTVPSRYLAAPREVTVYLPPGATPPEAVVYMGDGQSVAGLAPVLDSLITSGALPRVMLVGAHAAGRTGDEGPLGDGRALEYLYDYGATYGGDDARFRAHDRFFAEELVAWAQQRWNAPRTRRARAVMGFSNGGAMAVQQGLRHGRSFAQVIALSPAGHVPERIRNRAGPVAARFYLSGGLLEPSPHLTAAEWKTLLEARGFQVRLEEPVAGHDPNSWAAQLKDALQWAFPR